MEARVHEDGAAVIDLAGIDLEAAGIYTAEVQLRGGDGFGGAGNIAEKEGDRTQKTGQVQNAQMLLAHNDVVPKRRGSSQKIRFRQERKANWRV